MLLTLVVRRVSIVCLFDDAGKWGAISEGKVQMKVMGIWVEIYHANQEMCI